MLIFKRIYKKKKRKKKRLTREQREEAVLRRKWGMDVKKANGYVCCITGCASKKRLVAHHLDSYHTHPDRRFDISNGVVLERSLHKKFHSIYGYKDTTKEQFFEFYRKEILEMATKKKGAPKKGTKKDVPATGVMPMKGPMKGKGGC